MAATKPDRELLAAEQLRNQAFEAYCPLRRKTVRHARRMVTRRAPLFPGYVFVRMDVQAVRWRAINGTLGVKYLITQNERPVPLPQGFVETLARHVSEDGTVTFGAQVKVGDRVEVMAGPFARQIGELTKVDDRGRVAILLNVLSSRISVGTTIANLLPA